MSLVIAASWTSAMDADVSPIPRRCLGVVASHVASFRAPGCSNRVTCRPRRADRGLHVRASAASSSDAASDTTSRRRVLRGAGAAIASVAGGRVSPSGWLASVAFADEAETIGGASTNAAGSSDAVESAAQTTTAQTTPVPAVRYKGTNWSVVVPGTYERMSTEKPRRIYAQKEGLDCEPNCRDLQAKRTEESPLVARFGSEEQQADISVSIRGANTLKLTFLQIKDVTEFGDVKEAAPLFIPPGCNLISATSRVESQLNGAGEPLNKAYYTYDFEYGAARILLTAAVDGGNVVLLGATATKETWEAAESGFRRAAATFKVGPDAASTASKPAAAAQEAKAARGEEAVVPLTRPNTGPSEQMNCKGPLPFMCSVEMSE